MAYIRNTSTYWNRLVILVNLGKLRKIEFNGKSTNIQMSRTKNIFLIVEPSIPNMTSRLMMKLKTVIFNSSFVFIEKETITKDQYFIPQIHIITMHRKENRTGIVFQQNWFKSTDLPRFVKFQISELDENKHH